MEGLTFDTGALIALERRRQRMAEIFIRAKQRGTRITIPAVVVAEWWRKRSDAVEAIFRACDLEPMDIALARRAGEAIAAVPNAQTIDAVVMASAAHRGDIVYTSDVSDLERLRRHFPAVRVLAA